MWDKIRRQFDRKNRSGELYYATHHHLIPLYALVGITMILTIVTSLFVAVLWHDTKNNETLKLANTVADTVDASYLPTTVSPTEKKQYVYSADVRFAIDSPYDTLLYSFDPGQAGTKTSATIALTASSRINKFVVAMNHDPEHAGTYAGQLSKCAKLYIIRFQPGAIAEGGFAPLTEVKLKDGRTAYVHKNSRCVPGSTADMNAIDKVERSVLTIESF
jgi:hypothetical protein